MNPEPHPSSPTARVDKWLWAIRAYRTRTLATQACTASHVRINGIAVKPSRAIKLGDVVEARNGDILRTFRVKDFLERRVGAREVFRYAEETTPLPDPAAQSSPMVSNRMEQRDRPDSRERRRIRELSEGGNWA